MTTTDIVSDTALEHENLLLRQRVSDLQRRLARFSTDGASRTIHGVNVSISEREELLVEAERIAKMGSWVWNIESNQVVWSDELYRILGYDPDKDIASVEAFFEAVHPDDRQQVREISANITQTGVTGCAEHRILHRDGTVLFVLSDGAPIFDKHGKLRRVVGTILNVTEARETARRLAQSNRLLEEAQALGHMGSWTLDLANGQMQWSEEFCRIFGIAADTAASPDTFMQYVHADDRQIILAAHESMLRSGASTQVDIRLIRNDGEGRFVRVIGSPHYDASGQLAQIRGAMLDLTDLRRLQERLLEAERMEAIGRLAGGIAHDFNNLLMVVRGNLELLEAQARPELKAIFSAIDSAQSLTAGLLAFGRKANLQRRVLDLNQLANSTVALLDRLVGEHITLRSFNDVNVPAVEVDSALIQQALVNLVINARDALVLGGTISVRTQLAIEGGNRYAEISVEDNGPGIDDATLKHLFEPFFTTKDGGKGSGLGLAMVHGTVTQHGGSVRVTSTLGRGSRFTLRIPAAVESIDDTKGTAAALHPTNLKQTILVVEDHPDVLSLLEALLQKAGYRVVGADRPSAALAIVREQSTIDLVLSDLNMPEMHGTSLARELRRHRPGLPIIFMSGYSGDTTRLPVGAKLLGKPFSVAELQEAIDEAIAIRN
jgi:PAS domain S-box-containing protein